MKLKKKRNKKRPNARIITVRTGDDNRVYGVSVSSAAHGCVFLVVDVGVLRENMRLTIVEI